MQEDGSAPRFSLAGVLHMAVGSGREPSRPVHAINFAGKRIDGPLRIFIAHTSNAFLAFRTSLEEKGERRQLISRVSKLYRSALAQLNESRASEGAPSYVFRAVESVWQLCEILIIDPQATPGVLIQQLQQWAAAWSSSSSVKLSPKSTPDSDEDDNESFWDNFMILIMLGQIEDACVLLRSHKSGSREDFLLMTKVLRSMPVLGQGIHLYFLNQWTEWQDTVRQLVEEGRFEEEPRFHSACRLLSGDSAELDRRKRLCDSWFQFVVTKAAYSQPLLKVGDLGKLADEALKVAAVADRLGLPEAALAIYRTQSVHWLKQDKLDSALTWAIRSRNSPLVSRVAELVLEDYLRSGRLSCADHLRGLGQEMLVSERLMFLAKYAEFLRLRDENCKDAESENLDGAAQAAGLLLFLINSEWSPNFFVARLLEDAVQLLADDRLPPQNIAHLQRLMACLQNAVKARPNELKKDLLDKLNFACAKRTAQSLLSFMQLPIESVVPMN
ncbi:nuclear pore complex protein Nup85-like [Tropilaelaps mercedesae]|uniref:Nuclear pore complex protein Nup85 n=1 Tax=Tropilaelaps mercedesae TaxID=418985 RepID=A0A1V9Y3G7_9ACAR|nr:nuclear pore complex protein Nup85-like [Tropilaelaps mercedesae]